MQTQGVCDMQSSPSTADSVADTSTFPDITVGALALERVDDECRVYWRDRSFSVTTAKYLMLHMLACNTNVVVPYRDLFWSYQPIDHRSRGDGTGFMTCVRSMMKRIIASFHAVDAKFDVVINFVGVGYSWGPIQEPSADSPYAFGKCQRGPIVVYPANSCVFWGDVRVHLTVTEARVLTLLLSRTDWVSYRTIYDVVRSVGFTAGSDGYATNVRSFIARMRRKFERIDDSFSAIENQDRLGYRWRMDH